MLVQAVPATQALGARSIPVRVAPPTQVRAAPCTMVQAGQHMMALAEPHTPAQVAPVTLGQAEHAIPAPAAEEIVPEFAASGAGANRKRPFD